MKFFILFIGLCIFWTTEAQLVAPSGYELQPKNPRVVHATGVGGQLKYQKGVEEAEGIQARSEAQESTTPAEDSVAKNEPQKPGIRPPPRVRAPISPPD
ncbi:hypothetical protein RB195_021303 [Necator americanus]